MAGRLRLPSRPRGPRDEARMTLIEHLGELRSRIIKVGVAFFVAAVVAWFFRVRIFGWLLAPAGDALSGKLSVTSVTEQLFTDMKLALYVGFLLTIPVLLYQAWAFVAPAVGDLGRVFTYTIIALASALFLAGVAFGYFVVLPIGTQFPAVRAGGRDPAAVLRELDRLRDAGGDLRGGEAGARRRPVFEAVPQARDRPQLYSRRRSHAGSGSVQHGPDGCADGRYV